MDDFRETLRTVDKRGNRLWVYPYEIAGFFQSRRRLLAFVLIAIYCSLPWIEISGVQAVYLDIYHRKFTFFGQTFWATDTNFLLLVLLSLAFSLFFFSAILGRIWCGWACPETVFMEFVFRPLEALIEGRSSERKKRDAAPWSVAKIGIKLLKWFVFAAVSWFLASTVLAYFIGRERLIAMMFDSPWNNSSTFLLTLALMAILLFQFGWFREQFCTIVCPYARFQSVLLDDSSLLVGYDYKRGEPRGKARAEARGHCVDCGLCVRVCPTGIDIRDGLQLECIQCAQCADACDSIMAKVGQPAGLIRYDTERGLAGNKTRFLRPRVVIYILILATVFSLLLFSVFTREFSSAQLLHSVSSNLYSVRSDGKIENHLELRLENKSSRRKNFSVESKDSSFDLVVPIKPFPVEPGAHGRLPVFVSFDPAKLNMGNITASFIVKDDSGFSQEIKIELIGPG